MAARVESQAGDADDGAAPSIPSAFENDHVLGATEAIMWIACRRRFSHDTIQEHLRRHRPRGQWRYGRSQLRRPLYERAEKAERQLIGLIIGGVPATGTLHDEGDPDHKKRVPVPVEFLKDGAYIELLSGHIRADPVLEKHSGYQRPTYRNVDVDRDAFFKALAAAEPASTRRRGARPTIKPRRPGGRKKGSGSFAAMDEPLLKMMKPLIASGTSHWAAAMTVVSKAAGNSIDESKAKRLVARFKEWEKNNSV